jgi:hypothetical protein
MRRTRRFMPSVLSLDVRAVPSIVGDMAAAAAPAPVPLVATPTDIGPDGLPSPTILESVVPSSITTSDITNTPLATVTQTMA